MTGAATSTGRLDDSASPVVLVAGWLCLLAGAIGSAGLSMTTELVEADTARCRAATAAAELAAVEAEADGWSQIAVALRTDSAFRDEWARRELPGLLPPPSGIPLHAAARVDLRRPPVAVVEAVPPADWRPIAQRLERTRCLQPTAILLMALGVVTAAPRRLYGRGPVAYLKARYRVDPGHSIDPPHAVEVDAVSTTRC